MDPGAISRFEKDGMDVTPDDQEEVIGLIERVSDALGRGDLEGAEETAQELEDIFFYLEEA